MRERVNYSPFGLSAIVTDQQEKLLVKMVKRLNVNQNFRRVGGNERANGAQVSSFGESGEHMPIIHLIQRDRTNSCPELARALVATK